MKILKDIPFDIDLPRLHAELHLREGTEDGGALRELVRAAVPAARPKALYETAYIEERGRDTLRINGVTFKSRALVKNLEPVERVFPYVATCGLELDRFPLSGDDLLQRFWLDAIQEMALDAALAHLTDGLRRRHGIGQISSMSPGAASEDVWPIEQQAALFSLLGDTRSSIGVELLPSLLMTPTKTVSGIAFASEARFEDCKLCAREVCPKRRAPFDKALFDSIYQDEG